MSKKKRTKRFLVLAGPNGSGKTTLANFFLKFYSISQFVNADVIAKGLGGNFNGNEIKSGKIMISKIFETLKSGESFAVETTLSGRSWFRIFNFAKEKGYEIVLCFMSIETPELAVERVECRVNEGGHHIPSATVKRRFFRSHKMFFNEYRQCVDKWYLFDNSELSAKLLAKKENLQESILLKSKWNQLLEKFYD